MFGLVSVYDELVKILGGEKVSNSLVDLISYSRDFWPIALYKFLKDFDFKKPMVVVFPSSVEDVVKVVRFAYEREIPLYPYGGGSGVLGAATLGEEGIVLDLKGLDFIKIYPEDNFVEVGAGVNGMSLELYLNARGYTIGHFPQSLYTSTVGGWVSTKAIGQFSTKYGGIEDILLGLQVVIPSGKIIDFLPKPRGVAFQEMMKLFVGSEGMFGVVTKAFLKIFSLPKTRRFLSFLSNSFGEAISLVREVLDMGVKPGVVRIFDHIETLKWFNMVKVPKGFSGTIFILEGDERMVEAETKILFDVFGEKNFVGGEPAENWFRNRFNVKEFSEFFPLGIVVDTIEVSVNWSKAEKLYEDVVEAIKSVEGTLLVYAHASHFYHNGLCIYFIFAGIPPKNSSIYEYYNRVWEAAMEATLNNGGSITDHHGIGRMKAKWFKEDLGEDLVDIYRRIKRIFDEKNILNRGNMGV